MRGGAIGPSGIENREEQGKGQKQRSFRPHDVSKTTIYRFYMMFFFKYIFDALCLQ